MSFNTDALATLLILLLSITFTIDSMQVAVKIMAASLNTPILGAHTSQVLLLINRGTAAIALLCIGLLVDKGVTAQYLLSIYAATALLTAILHTLALNFKFIESITIKSIKLLHGHFLTNPGRSNDYSTTPGTTKWTSLIFVSIVTYLGLLGPSLFATEFQNYRATLMQSGFILNTFGTLVYVLVIEKEIAATINSNAIANIMSLYKKYRRSRIKAYLIIGLILSIAAMLLA